MAFISTLGALEFFLKLFSCIYIFYFCSVRMEICHCICIIPTPFSPMGETSNFIEISTYSLSDTIFYYIKGILICSIITAIKHSLCWKYDIWKLTLSIKVLNLWSKSQIDFVGSYLISFNSVI